MKGGSTIARSILTGTPVRVGWEDGVITSIATVEGEAVADVPWIAPPLVDLQINGYAGVDFQQDNLSEEQLLTAVRALRRDGCGRFLFTVITDHWSKLMNRLAHVRSVVDANPELCRTIVGWHVEGPFLSSEPGYCGAHNPAKMIDPQPKHLDELREVLGTDPVLLTMAPERPGSVDAIRNAVERGMRISLGHTNASTDELRAAVDAGATGFTHLGNGCPQMLDRHDNIIGRVLDTPGLTVSLIHDTHHVSPSLFRLVHRVLPPERIIHTTDAMSAAGAGEGTFPFGDMNLDVGADGIVRQPGRSNFAGSSLTPIDGVFRAAKMTGKPWQEMWLNSSLRPAEFMGWSGALKVGQPAEFCLIEVDDERGVPSLEINSPRSD